MTCGAVGHLLGLMELHGEFSFEVRVGQQHRRTETLNHKIVYNGDELSPNYTTIIHRQVIKVLPPHS